MRRFWLEPQAWESDHLTIQGELFHHLRDVCRFQEGEEFELLETGRAWLVRLVACEKKSLTVKRLEARALPELPKPHLHLVLSVPRFSTVDWIVEKSVELGVKSLQLMVSDFSFVRSKKELPKAKMERWQKLIRQASQQSGRGTLMELPEVTSLAEILPQVNRQPNVRCLFAYEGKCEQTLKQALQGEKAKAHDQIYVFIGSEGGFSAPEVEEFRRLGLPPLTLGEQVLRVETACLALASILKYEFELLD